MRLRRGPAAWARLALLAIVLVGAAVMPSRAASSQPQRCAGLTCITPGSVLWTAALPGAWLAQPGVSGTETISGAYAAEGGGLAVIGTGTTVTAFQSSTGGQLWSTSLAGLSPAATIVGVRAFPGVVAVGVEPASGRHVSRHEVIIAAATGAPLRQYPAAPFGGAVAASRSSVVIVGPRSVTDYATATGRVLWRRDTGPAGQTWRVFDGAIYVTVPGSRSPGRVVALRRIDLRTGAEHLIRLAGRGVIGTFSQVAGGYLLFTGPRGVQCYDSEGQLLWSRPAAAVELASSGQDTVYLASGNLLIGVDAATGAVISRSSIAVAASLYWVSGGVAIGLDKNALGEAWGYDLATSRVIWSSRSLPWPHFFVDLSGLGGSATATGNTILLATCAQVGQAAQATAAPACRRPRLAAVLIAGRAG